MEIYDKITIKKAISDGIGFSDIPLGLRMALAENISAMQVFAEMSDERRAEIIDGARGIESKSDMKKYVRGIR